MFEAADMSSFASGPPNIWRPPSADLGERPAHDAVTIEQELADELAWAAASICWSASVTS